MNRRPALLAPLVEPRFRLLFAGQAVSSVGDWLDYVALLTLVAYVWRLGPAPLAAVVVATALPLLAASPVAGACADRLPTRTVMIACDLGRAAVVLGLVFAPDLPVLLVLVAAKSVLAGLFAPSQQVSIRHVVSPRHLLAASSLSQLAVQGSKVVGPALGGLLVAAVGVRPLFAIDAATFAASALLLWRVGSLPRARPDAAGRGIRADLVEGLRFVATSRALLAAITGVAMTVLAVFTYDMLSPLALLRLGLDSSEFGVSIGLVGLGAFAGSAMIGQWGGGLAPLALLAWSQVAAGALLVLMGAAVVAAVHPGPAAWVPAMVGLGAASAGILVAYSYIVQLETPAALVGRVSATAFAVLSGAQIAAPPVGAALATAFGVGTVIAGAGLAVTAIGLVLLWLESQRRARPAVPVEHGLQGRQ